MRLFDDAMTLSAAPRTAIEMMNLALDVLEDSHGQAD